MCARTVYINMFGTTAHHLVEIYSVYGCFEYTLLHEPKSASFRTESYRETQAVGECYLPKHVADE